MNNSKTPECAAAQDSVAEQTAQALLNLRCAVDHSHDAVFITDPEGKIEFVNPAFEELTGFWSRKAVGSNLRLLATENSAAADFEGILKQVIERGVYRGGLEFRNKNGKVIEVD
jgi:PAS domain S-box-containing protein